MRLHPGDVLRSVDEAEHYVTKICFKTGPPVAVGVELEWTVHDATDPIRPADPDRLRAALGPHAPTTLDPAGPGRPLPEGGAVTVEPGGQVEISTQPYPSLAALHRATCADIGRLTGLLAAAGLTLGDSGIDAHRPPGPAIDTPRYRAMRAAFDRRGVDGRTMMYSTAGLQVCVDAGEAPTERWAALNALGPPLVAAFATASRHAGRPTGFASARMATWLRMDPGRTWPVVGPDPAVAWSRYALSATLLCVRREHADWTAPPDVRFRDWIEGAFGPPPTVGDLDYHLTTLFPPVRPRGYLEVRYLDTQPAGEWIAPVGVLAALLAEPSALSLAREACEPVEHRWSDAARLGLTDPALASAATAVLDAGCRALDRTDLPAEVRGHINEIVARRLGARRRNGRG